MLQTLLSRFGWFVALLLLQVFVFNHVHILGYATPLPYLYLLLILPSATPRWVYVLVGFAFGLLLDLFTNTPGMAAAALCLTGLFVPLLLRAFAPKDSDDDTFLPSRRSMETGGFLKYAFSATLVLCAAFFTIEAFSFFDPLTLLYNIAGSTLLTTLFVWGIELIRTR